ncbi:hypothetical protein [Haloarcula halophila]|uniref:hypothetical protein n=1 Tax=Haloarcula TaxID=2237 RepID=UPI0023E35DAF|nr:hypothetical protein [Halomicroarcula sp. DFY41]
MGEQLMEYYAIVEDEQGLSGKMELAKKTNLPGTKASTAPDSEENIELFREAVTEILGEQPPHV